MTNQEIYNAVKDNLLSVCSISETELELETQDNKYIVNREEFAKDYVIIPSEGINELNGKIYPKIYNIRER